MSQDGCGRGADFDLRDSGNAQAPFGRERGLLPKKSNAHECWKSERTTAYFRASRWSKVTRARRARCAREVTISSARVCESGWNHLSQDGFGRGADFDLPWDESLFRDAVRGNASDSSAEGARSTSLESLGALALPVGGTEKVAGTTVMPQKPLAAASVGGPSVSPG